MPQVPQFSNPQTAGASTPAQAIPAPASVVPGTQISSRAAKVFGFCVAGGALVVLADFAPQAAIGLTCVIGLGVLIGHPNELRTLTNAFTAATGGTPLPAVGG